MLRKELPAVFPGLVFLEHRPGPGILDRGRLQFLIGLEGCLGTLDLAGKRVETLRGLRRFLFQLPILHQIIFLQKSQGGGHLFQVENLGPPLISRPLPLEPGLDVDNQVDPWAWLACASLGTGQCRLYILLAVALPQRGGTQAGKPFLAGSPEADCAPLLLYLIAGLLHEGEKGGKVGGLFFKGRVNGGAQLLLEGKRPFPALGPLPIALIFPLAFLLRLPHHREAVFQTEGVGQPPQGTAGAEEVPVFMGAVKGGGIVINVVMDMGLVRVGGDDELVPSLRPPHSQLIADTVGVLRRDLPGKEGLAYLVAEHVPVRLLLPARGGFVPAFPQEKFSVHRGRVTFISGDIFPFFRLDRVLPIVGTVLYGLRHGEPRRGLAFHQPRGGYGPSLLPASGQLGPK